MTLEDFWQTINRACDTFHASVTSGHRSKARNARVGGAANSQHLGYKAVDIVLDDWNEKNPCIDMLAAHGLYVLDEVATKNHLHIDDRNDSDA